MSRSGSIILIDDDEDDGEIFTDTMREIDNSREVIWFRNTMECMSYLLHSDESPFLIFCDVNLPMQNGIDFKREVDNDPALRKKSIPSVFYSTSVDQIIVNEAYSKMTVQGFFRKESSLEDIRQCLTVIMDYWELCHHPNTF